MKPKFILTIGLLAIVVGVATTGIAMQSVQAGPEAQAAKIKVSKSLIQHNSQIIFDPNRSDQVKTSLTEKYSQIIKGLNPNVADCELNGQCVNENNNP